MTKFRLLVACLLLAAAPGAPSGASAGVATGESAATAGSAALFSSLERTAGGVTTLSSDFVQEKHLSMFKTVLSSKGRFYFSKPDRLRWELTAPVASGFVLRGEKGRRWHERTGRTENFQISQEPVMKLVSDQLFAWARADFGWLKREYRISVLSAAPAALRLEPRSAATAGFLHHLLINFSADGRYVKSVEVHEKDGDFTRIKFLNTAVNRKLSADLF
jgi:outer membrane lipoprotein-sorting protein